MNTHKYLVLIILVFAVLLISSCTVVMPVSYSTGKANFDPSLPPERTTVVVFEGSIYVSEYNGIDVRKAWYPKEERLTNTVTLPAGQATIKFDLRASIAKGDTYYRANRDDMELRYNFEAGRVYFIGVYREDTGAKTWDKGNFKFGIAIWDDSTKHKKDKANALQFWELGEA